MSGFNGMTAHNPFPMLEGEQYLSLTTYRKDGRAVPTPVWFAQDGDRLYIFTLGNAGKIKRLRHTSKVEIAPCDARGTIHGDSVSAQAQLHTADSAVGQQADAALNQKYGLLKRLFGVIYWLRRTSRMFIEIRPIS
jgi:uncharacterized protein